jgi:cyclophilin family peptidyl-prolyl cis-trans isomerase
MNLQKTLIAGCLAGLGSCVAAEPRVAMDLTIDDEPAGTIVADLFSSAVPKTAENFRSLCAGEPGYGYDNSPFHRIIPEFMMQGGDFTNRNGTGGYSATSTTAPFADENFDLKHDARGLLSMANSGPDTNRSQFFVTFAPTPWLDGKHVVFGKVVDGMDVLDKVEQLGTRSGRPLKPVELVDCRVLP